MTVADPFLYPSELSSDPLSPERRRWELWRSPDGQPAWARPVLLLIAALAAALFAWNITDAGLAPFYSVAVKSMSENWHAFFYGAFDPKATITIDKLAGSFAPQAISARIFGFHPWSLALPEVIEGVLSVLLMYRMVRRWAGAVPGLLAAALFALTPIVASMMGHSMEDGALTFCLVVAADQWTRAVVDNRLRNLLWAGFWVGVGFQCKMLQAWMVLPALFLAYLLCASSPLMRRIRDLALFTVVTVVTSLSWILLYTFTPAADRPYVDGSTNNSAWSMVFGYNGLERFGISVPGSVTSGPGVTTGGGGKGGGAGGLPGGAKEMEGIISKVGGSSALKEFEKMGGGHGGGMMGGGSGFGSGWTKLLGSEFGTQISWLFPLVILTIICGLVWTWRSRRTDKVRAGFVFWGLWFATFFLIFSDMSNIPHTAYVASMVPATAALSAAGIVMFWRAYRAGGRRGWMLPAAVTATLAWAAYTWESSYSGFLPWALWIAVAAGVIAVGVMIWARVSRRTSLRIATVALIVGIAAMLAPASTWAASVLDSNYAGSSFNASAGPGGGMGGAPGGGTSGSSSPQGTSRGAPSGVSGKMPSGSGKMPSGSAGPGMSGSPGGGQGTSSGSTGTSSGSKTGSSSAGGFPGPGSGAGGGMMGATTSLTASEQKIYNYVNAGKGSASYLMAVGSYEDASPYILSTGQEVLSMGGFSGSAPEPTLAKVQELVKNGQLKFFLLDSGTTGKSGTAAPGQTGSSATAAPGGAGGGGMMGGNSTTETSIDSWVEKTCTAVPAKDYGGTTSSTSSSASKSSSASQAAPGGMGSSNEKLYECDS